MATLEEGGQDSILLEHIAALYGSDPVAAHDLDSTRFDPAARGSSRPCCSLPRAVDLASNAWPHCYTPARTIRQGFYCSCQQWRSTEQSVLVHQDLLFNPACTVQVGKIDLYRAAACILTRGERAPYWNWMVRMWPPYARYQELTERCRFPCWRSSDPTEVLQFIA